MRSAKPLRSVGLWLVVVAGLALGCVSGTGGASPTDIGPQDQDRLARDMWLADEAGLDALLDFAVECVNVDQENDAVADRETPVLADD